MDTVAGRQIYDEGMGKGMKKGHIDNAREMLTDVLRERFGIAPEDVTHAVGRRDVLKNW